MTDARDEAITGTPRIIPLYDAVGPASQQFGMSMAQNRLAVPTWSYAMERYPPARVVEIGTCNGGFTIALGLHTHQIGARLISYDISQAPEERLVPLGRFLGIEFRTRDIWAAEAEIGALIAEPGVCYVLCDGGNKPRELSTFARYCKVGDVIAAHDYHVEGSQNAWWGWGEIRREDGEAAAAQHGLEPWMQDYFDTVAWLTFQRRGPRRSAHCSVPRGPDDLPSGDTADEPGKGPPSAVPEFFDLLEHTIVSGGDWCGTLMGEIARVLHEGGDWCDGVKAQSLATLVLALRPRVICEVGVWIGGSLIPMLLALRTLEKLEAARGSAPTMRRCIAIDAWSVEASLIGQDEADRAWWGAQSHQAAETLFRARLERHGLTRLCDVIPMASDEAPAPEPGSIGLLHLDGNHGEQAVRDVAKFASAVELGGVLILDDLAWAGGHVGRARDLAISLGFRELHPLGTGTVLQRIRDGRNVLG